MLDPAEIASINEYINNSIHNLKNAKPNRQQQEQQVDEELMASMDRPTEMWITENEAIHDIRHKYILIFRRKHGRLPTDMELEAVMSEMRKREHEIRSIVKSLNMRP